MARCGLGLNSIIQGDVEAIAEQYAALEMFRGTMPAVIACDRLLGLLAYSLERFADAQTHFEDALAFCRKAGYRPELAWSLCDYADMLLDPSTSSGQTAEDKAKAAAMLDESLAISTELGMRPLMERVLSRREILKA